MPASSFLPDHQPAEPGHLYLVTGSRDLPRLDLVWEWGRSLPSAAFLMHGAARGVDTEAARGFLHFHPIHQVLRRPANWSFDGIGAGVLRNHRMVDECVRLRQEGWAVWVTAFWDGASSGTKDCIDYAVSQGFAVTINHPYKPQETRTC